MACTNCREMLSQSASSTWAAASLARLCHITAIGRGWRGPCLALAIGRLLDTPLGEIFDDDGGNRR
jgi:hypothetical protein